MIRTKIVLKMDSKGQISTKHKGNTYDALDLIAYAFAEVACKCRKPNISNSELADHLSKALLELLNNLAPEENANQEADKQSEPLT